MQKLIKTNRLVALGTLGVMTLGMGALVSDSAHADSSGWKKATIGGAAVTGYGLIKGKGRVATVGAVTTAGSYLMYRKSKKKEAKRMAWYQQRYGRNWRKHYAAR